MRRKTASDREKFEASCDLIEAMGLCLCWSGAVEEEMGYLGARGRADLRQLGWAGSDADLKGIRELLINSNRTLLQDEGGVLVWKPARAEKCTSESMALSTLTRREIEVFEWLRKGKSAGEIGIILGASPRTVEKHQQNIYRKLSVSSAAELISKVGGGL